MLKLRRAVGALRATIKKENSHLPYKLELGDKFQFKTGDLQEILLIHESPPAKFYLVRSSAIYEIWVPTHLYLPILYLTSTSSTVFILFKLPETSERCFHHNNLDCDLEETAETGEGPRRNSIGKRFFILGLDCLPITDRSIIPWVKRLIKNKKQFGFISMTEHGQKVDKLSVPNYYILFLGTYAAGE